MRRVRPMLNSACVTESWSSRARWARSWLAASSTAWSRRSPASRSRSLMSRTEPCAPAKRPSTMVPVMATSVWLTPTIGQRQVEPERAARGRDPASGAPMRRPPRRASPSAARVANGRPISSSGFQPVRDSSESLKKVKLPSASTLHTMSGELSTRWRYRRSDSSTSAYSLALVSAIAAWSASSLSSSASPGVERVRGRRLDRDRADQAIRAEERRGHHRMDVLRLDARVTLVVREGRVGQVVAGPAHATLGGGHAGDARSERHDRHRPGMAAAARPRSAARGARRPRPPG